MQEYELIAIQHSDDPFTDPHGNTWLTVAFKGISEPVRWVVKDPSKLEVGKTYQGEIKEQMSKNNKPYQRFYRAKPEDQPQKKEWQPRDDASIRAQFAIKAAIQFHGQDASMTDIEATARTLFDMVDRVKARTVEASEEVEVVEGTVDSAWERAGQALRNEPGTTIRNSNGDPGPQPN